MTDLDLLNQMRPYYQTQDGSDRSTLFYDNAFANFLNGKNFNANFVAAFFPVLWMIYRRLYLPAFVYNIILSILLSLIALDNIPMLIPINILAMMFLGNFIYFKSIQLKINRSISPPSEEKTDKMAVQLYLLMSLSMVVLSQATGHLLWPLELIFWGWIYQKNLKKN